MQRQRQEDGHMAIAKQPCLKNNMLEDLDLPITQSCRGAITCPHKSAQIAHSIANSMYTLPYKHLQLKYMYQSFFSLPTQTINKAANNNQLHGTACLNSPKIVNKYLAPPPATSKGRLKKQSVNVHMSRPKKKDTTTTKPTKDVDKFPVPASVNPTTNIILDNHSTNKIFCCVILGNTTMGTF